MQGDAFVAVDKAVILDQAVKQSRRALFNFRLKKFTAKSLEWSVDCRFNQAEVANARCLFELLMK